MMVALATLSLEGKYGSTEYQQFVCLTSHQNFLLCYTERQQLVPNRWDILHLIVPEQNPIYIRKHRIICGLTHLQFREYVWLNIAKSCRFQIMKKGFSKIRFYITRIPEYFKLVESLYRIDMIPEKQCRKASYFDGRMNTESVLRQFASLVW